MVLFALAGLIVMVDSRVQGQPWPGPDPNNPPVKPSGPTVKPQPPVHGPGFQRGQRDYGPRSQPPINTLAACLACCDDPTRNDRPNVILDCESYCRGVQWVLIQPPLWTWPF